MKNVSLIITYFYEDPAEPIPGLLRGLFPKCDHCKEPGWEVFEPAPGVLIQCCSSIAQAPDFLVKSPQPVILYAVPDLATAKEQAIRQGAAALLETGDDPSETCYCYLSYPGGKVTGFFK